MNYSRNSFVDTIILLQHEQYNNDTDTDNDYNYDYDTMKDNDDDNDDHNTMDPEWRSEYWLNEWKDWLGERVR